MRMALHFASAALASAALASAALAVSTFVTPAFAQSDFPNKTIRLLVGFPAGGSTDVLGRIMGQEIRKSTGQDVLIINKPGASGALAINELISSPADGYTVVLTPSTITTLAHKFQNIRTDMLESTSAIAMTGRLRVGIATRIDSPVKTLKEFISAARAQPGKLSVGVPGAGTMSALIIIAVIRHENVEVNIVPMLGDAPVSSAILGGHISAGSASSAAWTIHVREGTMHLLASAEGLRSEAAPDVPTLQEAGYPYKSSAIQYVLAPKGLPEPVRQKLIELFTAASRTPNYIDIAKKNDLFDNQLLNGDALDKYLLDDRAAISALVDSLGMGRK